MLLKTKTRRFFSFPQKPEEKQHDSGSGEDAHREPSVRAESVQRLENELHEHLASLLAVEKDLQARNAAVESLQKTIQSHETSLTALRDSLASTERERDSAQQDFIRTRAELKETERKGEAARQRADSGAAEAGSLRATLERLQHELDRLKAAESSQAEQLASHRDALIGMKQVIAQKEMALDARERESAALAVAMVQLEQSAAEFRGRCDESERANVKLQGALAESNKALECRSDELQQAQATIERLNSEAVDQENVAESLRSELAAANGQNEELNQELANVQNSLETTRKKLTSAVKARELNAALDTERANGARLLADIAERERQITELSGAVDRASAEAGEARSATADVRERLESLSDEHEKALAAVKQEWVEAMEDYDGANILVTQKDAELSELRLTIEDLNTGRQELNLEIDSLKRVVDDLESELRTKRRLIASLERDGAPPGGADTIQMMEMTGKFEADPLDDTATSSQPPTLISQGEGETQYPLTKATVILGRSSDCDIRVVGKFTSRRHARIVTDEAESTIEDMNSSNGIKVNSEPVKRQRLCDGDMVDIGGNLFTFFNPQSCESGRVKRRGEAGNIELAEILSRHREKA